MNGNDLCVNKCKQSRSYLNHLVYIDNEKGFHSIYTKIFVFLNDI